MKAIYKLAIRELVKVIKDKNLLLIFIVAPLLYPMFYGVIYLDKAESDIPVAILDKDDTALSRGLTRTIDAHQNIKIVMAMKDESEIEDILALQKAVAVIFIPDGFEESLKKGVKTSVGLYLNPCRLLVMSDAGIPAYQLITAFGAKVTSSLLASKGVPVFQDNNLAQPLKFDFAYLQNPYLTYGDMILLPLIMIILSQLTLIGVTSATAKEYSLADWRETLSISRSGTINLISRIVFYLMLFLFFVILIRLIVVDLLDVRMIGTDINTFAVFLLGITANTAFGLFLGTFFRHRVAVFIILGFTSYPFFLISGYAWPVFQIPDYLEYFARLFPSTPFLKAGFKIGETGAPLTAGNLELLNFAVLIIVYSIGYIRRIRSMGRKRI